MPKIMLTPEFLTEKASEVENCRSEQEEIIRSVGTLIDSLITGWEGAAQRAFQAAFDERRGTYAQFAPDLSRFSEFLSTYARTMEDIDNAEGGRVPR